MTENSPAYAEWLHTMRPVFITCTSGTNAFTDMMVSLANAGVRITGHTEMTLTKTEAVSLAQTLIRFAEALP